MHLLITLIIGCVAILLMTSCARGGDDKKNQPKISAPVNSRNIKGLNKNDIKLRLNKLSAQPKIDRVSGAMCYKVAGPPNTMEYVCPDCGEKTLYDRYAGPGKNCIWFLHRGLQACRREIKELEKLVDGNIKLIEKQFCRKCTPDEVNEPKLALELLYNTGEKRTVKGISHNDLVILREFFEGKRVHQGMNDFRYPLQDSIKRIEELLGVELGGTALIGLSRDEIRKKMKKLAKAKEPKAVMGAMCYEMAAPPAKADYTCPDCGEKTVYEKNKVWLIEYELQGLRREYAELKLLADGKILFDETEFCRRCTPDVKDPEMYLIVKYKDGKHQKTPVSNSDVMRMVKEFMKGDRKHKSMNDSITPLKRNIKTLEKIFGVKLEEGDK